MFTLDLEGKTIKRLGRTYTGAKVSHVTMMPQDGEQNNKAVARLRLLNENGQVQDGIAIELVFDAQLIIDAMGNTEGWELS